MPPCTRNHRCDRQHPGNRSARECVWGGNKCCTLVNKFCQQRIVARDLDTPWDITFADFELVTRSNICEYGSGVEVEGVYVGVDAADPKLGHVRGNLVACCGWHNLLKGGYLSREAMHTLITMHPEYRLCKNSEQNKRRMNSRIKREKNRNALAA